MPDTCPALDILRGTMGDRQPRHVPADGSRTFCRHCHSTFTPRRTR